MKKIVIPRVGSPKNLEIQVEIQVRKSGRGHPPPNFSNGIALRSVAKTLQNISLKPNHSSL